MKRPKEKRAPIPSPALLTASCRAYFEVAGTNIEDLDRALKSSGWRTACAHEKDEQLVR